MSSVARSKLEQPAGPRGLLLAVLWRSWADWQFARRKPDWRPSSRAKGFSDEWLQSGLSLYDELLDWFTSDEFAGMCDALGLDACWVRKRFAVSQR